MNTTSCLKKSSNIEALMIQNMGDMANSTERTVCDVFTRETDLPEVSGVLLGWIQLLVMSAVVFFNKANIQALWVRLTPN